MATWLAYMLRSSVEIVESRLSDGLDYLVFWSMHKDLAQLPNRPLTSTFYLVSGVYWEVSHTMQMPRAIKFCAQLTIPTFG